MDSAKRPCFAREIPQAEVYLIGGAIFFAGRAEKEYGTTSGKTRTCVVNLYGVEVEPG